MTMQLTTIPLKKMLAVAVMGAVLAGCKSTNPYTGEEETSKSAKYGIGGALAGAAVGAIADGGEGAWKGALVGAAAGTGYGYYADKQEARLKSELAGTGVQVNRDPRDDTLTLIMPGHVTFETSKSDIKASFYPVLGSVAKIFQEFDENLIEIIGYTDSSGSDSINYPLSQSRADSVLQYLKGQGISATRMTAVGKGPQNPIGDNKTKEGKALNRRVEINLRPVPQQP